AAAQLPGGRPDVLPGLLQQSPAFSVVQAGELPGVFGSHTGAPQVVYHFRAPLPPPAPPPPPLFTAVPQLTARAGRSMLVISAAQVRCVHVTIGFFMSAIIPEVGPSFSSWLRDRR